MDGCDDQKLRQRRDVGYTLVSLLKLRLQEGMRKNRVAEEEFDENQLAAIEKAFSGGDGTQEEHLLAGLVMAGNRGLVAEDTEMAEAALLLGLREAYNFHVAKQPTLAESSLAWVERRLPHLRDRSPEFLCILGSMFAGAATGARQGGYYTSQLRLLQQARAFLPRQGDECAACLFSIGQEHERQGNTAEAMRLYREALQTKGITDPQLRGVIEASLSSIRAGLEGDPTKFGASAESARAFGYDPAFFEAFQRITAKMSAGRPVSDEEYAAAGKAALTLINKWEKENHPADALSVLVLYGY